MAWKKTETTSKRKVVIPTEPNSFDVAVDTINMYLYAPPGFGKSTIAAQMFPKALFLATDVKGLRFLNVKKMPIELWDTFLDILEELETHPIDFPIVIDVIDLLYILCMQYVCAKEGFDYPSDDKRQGTTWFNVRNEFHRAILRLINLETGVVFLGHLDEQTRRTNSGDITVVRPGLAPQAFEIVSKLVDITACGTWEKEYNKETKKSTERRVLQLVPNSSVSAKQRLGTLPETCEFDAQTFKKAIKTAVAELLKNHSEV